MSGWDQSQITSANIGSTQLQLQQSTNQLTASNATRVQSQELYARFIRTFKSTDTTTFIYRDQLQANYRQSIYTLTIDIQHLRMFQNGELYELLWKKPAEYIHVFELAARDVAIQICSLDITQPIHDVQIILHNHYIQPSIRNLTTKYINQLISIRGIVVSAGRPRVKATKLCIMCRNCKMTKYLDLGSGFGSVVLPRECDTRIQPGTDMVKCGLDPYMILSDSTECIDQQRLKLQEHPESIPTGELPRNISLAVEKSLVGHVKPGNRVTVVGMYTTYEAASKGESSKTGTSDVGIRIPYIRVFGIIHDSSANDILINKFSAEEEQQLKDLPITEGSNLYNKICQSMCPAIYENDDIRDIKQALAIQLFGGTPRQLPDKLRLRGDINILLLGDPSVAKSQFLKFVHQVAPIGVYTSGKGSSAAGLTASVIRDSTSGEFHLEGGALVLADGGLVCIDEFDKMREDDRVAIHEAMEQQTISIAKAGITTQLNSRTSVLAAANPVFGRYDDMKSPTENIDFQTSILSRFDMIFIVRDIQDIDRDTNLAKHVINVHRLRDAAITQNNTLNSAGGILDINLLKRYIAYARMNVKPTLNQAAQNSLKNYYVLTRSKIAAQNTAGAGNVIPITVRQLEAIIRIAEARARIDLTSVVNENHVKHAIRLFEVSTLRAATASFTETGVLSNQFNTLIKQAESYILPNISMGESKQLNSIKNILKDRGCTEQAINMAISNYIKKGVLQERNQGRLLYRAR